MGNWESRSERIDIDDAQYDTWADGIQYPTTKLASKYTGYDNKAWAFLSFNKFRPHNIVLRHSQYVKYVKVFLYVKDSLKYVQKIRGSKLVCPRWMLPTAPSWRKCPQLQLNLAI